VTEDFHDPANLSATLLNTFNGLPLVGRPVTFAIGAQSCGGTHGRDRSRRLRDHPQRGGRGLPADRQLPR
jgi:hypothetical protein